MEMQLTGFSDLTRVARLTEFHIHGRTHGLTALCACALCKRSIPIQSARLKEDWKESGNVFSALVRVPHALLWGEKLRHVMDMAALHWESIPSASCILSIKDLGFPFAESATAICADNTSFAKNNTEINLALRGSCVPHNNAFHLFLSCTLQHNFSLISHLCKTTFSGKLYIVLYWKLNPARKDLDSGSMILWLLADPDPAKCHVRLD